MPPSSIHPATTACLLWPVKPFHLHGSILALDYDLLYLANLHRHFTILKMACSAFQDVQQPSGGKKGIAEHTNGASASSSFSKSTLSPTAPTSTVVATLICPRVSKYKQDKCGCVAQRPTRIPVYSIPLCSKVLGCALLLAIRWSNRLVSSFKNLWHAYQVWA